MIVRTTSALPSEPKSAPREFRIWKAGENPTDKGLHILTKESLAAILEDQERRQNLYSIDVDHLSLDASAPPGVRRAVGWHRLEGRDGELWAVDVQWTDEVRGGLECDPPAWRYFSPAYSVNQKTGEILSYTNTALTNNPATWGLQALATRTSKGPTMPTMAELKAALKAMAEGADGEEKKDAAKMLAALDEHKEPDGDEAPAKAAEGADDEEKKDEKKDEASSVVASLSKVVQELSTKVSSLEKKHEVEEREALLASRKDLAPELVSIFREAPLSVVRTAVKKLPVAAKKNLAADATVTATRGEGQVDETATRLPKPEAEELAEKMGIATVRASIRREGNALVLGAMTREQAKDWIAKNAKEGAK